MMQIRKISFLLLLCVSTFIVNAQKYTNTETTEVTKEWNDETFTSTKSLSENFKESKNFSFLNKIFKDEKLITALEGEEMITIFVPLDAAFMKLPESSRDSLMESNQIRRVIRYYAVPGRIDSYAIKKAITQNGGVAFLTTMSGEKLGVKEMNGQLYLFDSEKNTALITDTDFYHKNGFFHITESLVFPEKESKR